MGREIFFRTYVDAAFKANPPPPMLFANASLMASSISLQNGSLMIAHTASTTSLALLFPPIKIEVTN